MIVDAARAPRSETPEHQRPRLGRVRTVHLSDAGGITQFGLHDQTFAPGASSGQRHWHEAEDEMLFVLEGTATVVDDDGPHDLGPGDAACWRHGDPNAHHVLNRGDLPMRYLVIGARVAGDICHYPDSGERQVNLDTTWAVLFAEGQALRGGDLPQALRNLPPVWGTPFDPALPGARIQRSADALWQDDADTPHLILGPGLGPYRYRLISDPGGLTQFGAFIEELPPGSSSGRRHWHEAEDEMIFVLEGEATLVEDSDAPLRPGDAVCWPAGHPVGHRIDNRSPRATRYLVVGTRLTHDRIHYTDHDLVTEKDGAARRYLRRDGTPYPRGAQP